MRKFARSIGSEGKRLGQPDGTVSFRDGLVAVDVFGLASCALHVLVMFACWKATSRGRG
jgi:hypothetical protein